LDILKNFGWTVWWTASILAGFIVLEGECGKILRYSWLGYLSVAVLLMSAWLGYKIFGRNEKLTPTQKTNAPQNAEVSVFVE